MKQNIDTITNDIYKMSNKRIFKISEPYNLAFLIGNWEHIIQAVLWGHYPKNYSCELFELNEQKFYKMYKKDIELLLKNHFVMQDLDDEQKEFIRRKIL